MAGTDPRIEPGDGQDGEQDKGECDQGQYERGQCHARPEKEKALAGEEHP
jgi:hypothetical protein